MSRRFQTLTKEGDSIGVVAWRWCWVSIEHGWTGATQTPTHNQRFEYVSRGCLYKGKALCLFSVDGFVSREFVTERIAKLLSKISEVRLFERWFD